MILSISFFQRKDVDVDREDASYWIEKAPKDKTHRLELVKEYPDIGLYEKDLQKYGFKGGRSLQQPMCRNLELLNYIEDCFQKKLVESERTVFVTYGL